jgi:hypothetical protein
LLVVRGKRPFSRSVPAFEFRLSQTGVMPINGIARVFVISVVRPANRCEVPAPYHLKDQEI